MQLSNVIIEYCSYMWFDVSAFNKMNPTDFKLEIL